MDEQQNNQSSTDQSQPTQSEMNQPEPAEPPTPQIDFTPPVEPEKKDKKKVLLAVLFIILLLGVGAGAWYFFFKEDDSSENVPDQTNVQTTQQEEVKEEVKEETEIFTSTLYPDFSFIVPEGWVVAEPAEYDEGEWGPGNTAGVITVTKDGVTLSLEMLTIYATGFEGYSCYSVDNLTAVGNYYRYTDSEGLTVFRTGLTESSPEWASTIADTDFTTLEDPDPNFCVSFPYIGTYTSILNQADYDLPYGYNDYEKVLVWLDATVSGPVDEAVLADIDSIILSKSASVGSE